jgi:hypothetical protein
MKIVFDTNGNEKQKECARAWVDPDISEIIYGGSKGSAKSYTGCSLIFGDAFHLSWNSLLYFKKAFKRSKKIYHPINTRSISALELPKANYKYNGQDSVFDLYNGSKVFLIDAKKLPSDPLYMRFGSMQMTRGWIEEAGEFEEEAKTNLFISCGRWKNDVYNLPLKLLMTCNPSKNFLYRDYKDFKKERLIKKEVHSSIA